MPLTSRREAVTTIAALAFVSFTALMNPSAALAQGTLNVLAWCDHLDRPLIEPFEKANNVTVNVKDYEGTGAALAIIEQSQPGDWDVFVVDSTDVKRVAGMGLLAELDKSIINWDDVLPGIRTPEFHEIDGKLYAVPEKFGYNHVAFNKTKVDPADVTSHDILTNPKYKGRVAIYDYYLSLISQFALAIGKTPNTITDEDLPKIRELLFAMKRNSVLVGSIATVQQALATGEVDIVLGADMGFVSNLVKDNPNLDWAVASTGSVRWQQSIGVFSKARNPDLAKKFVQYILSPEGQAVLSTSSCFWGWPANSKATLTDEQKAFLRFDQMPATVAASHPYPQLTNEFDKKLQDLWTEMLQLQ